MSISSLFLNLATHRLHWWQGLQPGYDSQVTELLTLDATRKRGCTVSWVARLERLHGCTGCVVAGVQLARA